MPFSKKDREGFRQKVRRHYDQLQSRSRDSSKYTQAEQLLPTKAPTSPLATANSLPIVQTSHQTRQSTDTEDNSASGNICNSLEQDVTADQLSLQDDIVNASSDVWSAAYREAVESLGEEKTIALHGKNAEQLFKELEEIEQEATRESAFLRGVRHLQGLKGPFGTFKLALDLTSPLADLEPIASTVFGVVRSVTAIAITFANANTNFAKQIAEMLQGISYIDECDTLGRKVDRKDIHKALVLVYQKILEFYDAALDILAKKGAKRVYMVISESDRLPNIIKEFLTSTDQLHRVIQKATLDIVGNIECMIHLQQFKEWLGKELGQQYLFRDEWSKERDDRACEFLLKNPNFINWYNKSESLQLVILGDMGHGKSFAMAFLAHTLSQRNKDRLFRPVLCQYYCRDEKTGQAVSIYCGILLSLLDQLEGLRKPFFERYKEAQGYHSDPASSTNTMEDLLQNMLESIDRPVIFVIDGLDECDRKSRHRLLEFLKTASQSSSGLKIILSARPQPEILEQLNGVARIEMGTDPERDLIIIEKKLEHLSYLSPDIKGLVKEKLSERAQGSAIWIRMITKLIECRNITALGKMETFLKEMPLPEDLSKLYDKLLSRYTSNDHENQLVAITALKLIAVSHRPLSIPEVAWAVELSLAQNITSVDALANMVDHQRVIFLINPFIASPNYVEVNKPQVQLIHQSVKEWISEQPIPKSSASKKSDQTDHVFQNPDAFLLDICIKYLLLDDFGDRDLFSSEQAAFAELPQFPGSFSDDEDAVEYDPKCTWESWEDDMARFDPVDRGFGEFFVYASCHWVDHFGTITAAPLPSLSSIETMCQAGSTRLRNWIQQNSRPGCTMLQRFEFDSNLYDPLSITSMYGSEAMLLHMLGNLRIDNGNYLEGSPMRAADQILQWGDVSRIRLLFLDGQAGRQLQCLDLFRLIIKRWDKARRFTNPWYKERQDWDVVFDLVESVSEKMVAEHWGNELLCLAAGEGCMPMVQRLMTRARYKGELRNELLRGTQIPEKQSSFDKPTHQSIGLAVLGNHVSIVEYLLGENDIEAHLQYRNSRCENVLHLASRICNPEMFHLLVPRFQEGIDAEDDQGDTPLVQIVMSPLTSRYESAIVFLLQCSTDWDSHPLDWQWDALRAAVTRRDLDMCCILIWIGNINPFSNLADVNEDRTDLKDRGPANDEVLLGTLVNLLVSEPEGHLAGSLSSVEESLQNLAEKHYTRRFGLNYSKVARDLLQLKCLVMFVSSIASDYV
ncbi:Protein of unknown function DUF3468 [Penicillium atrosanguineum]|uniref:Protein of unknown function DUF3468 n=1 Tax=Penicillium atrosanguineum TaxID=1132637 RepID=UPI00239B277D|nr:Protein of unknown function DUF3468 [Penicillium atrosanguineum]KAJ5289958.1 Protein of unknown function DUF3468 [Penicillium atrosanguineum]